MDDNKRSINGVITKFTEAKVAFAKRIEKAMESAEGYWERYEEGMDHADGYDWAYDLYQEICDIWADHCALEEAEGLLSGDAIDEGLGPKVKDKAVEFIAEL